MVDGDVCNVLELKFEEVYLGIYVDVFGYYVQEYYEVGFDIVFFSLDVFIGELKFFVYVNFRLLNLLVCSFFG